MSVLTKNEKGKIETTNYNPGQQVALQVYQDNQRLTVKVPLGKLPLG